MKLNGIDRNTAPRAPGIEILKDDNGEPNGIIVERNYMRMVEPDLLPAVPRFTLDDRIEGLRRSLPMYLQKGTTSVYEGHGCSPDVVASYRELHQRNELTLRSGLCLSPAWLATSDAEYAMRHWLSWARGSGLGDDMLRISGIFVGYGGSPQFAEVARKDLSDTGWSGGIPSINSPADFEALCMLAGKYGLRLHTSPPTNCMRSFRSSNASPNIIRSASGAGWSSTSANPIRAIWGPSRRWASPSR